MEIWDKRMKNNDLPLIERQTRFRHRKLPEKTQGVFGLQHPKTRQSTFVSVRFWKVFGGYFVNQRENYYTCIWKSRFKHLSLEGYQ